MKRLALPYLLLLPLLAVLLFGNCAQVEKMLTQRTAYQLLGGEIKPDQLTRLRAALQLEQELCQEATQKYASQPAEQREEIKRIKASTAIQLAGFLTPKQRRHLRQNRAKIARRLGISPGHINGN
ncbi:hypothetical protein [Hymenobacter convexus]|uniref:hypothetical protein n=1 Tax=Hymenobacter sp. CA1UV-4 TaxID=3063782 RepID=UPI002713BD4B|nr:hypothetical protein [Hymenobacter sp. CA1UV-4]MDO7850628.1 hypothetical protein [Hymenobacter sp. CA1UV-4]